MTTTGFAIIPGVRRHYPAWSRDIAIDMNADGSLRQIVVIIENVEIDITQAAMDLPCVAGMLQETTNA